MLKKLDFSCNKIVNRVKNFDGSIILNLRYEFSKLFLGKLKLGKKFIDETSINMEYIKSIL